MLKVAISPKSDHANQGDDRAHRATRTSAARPDFLVDQSKEPGQGEAEHQHTGITGSTMNMMSHEYQR